MRIVVQLGLLAMLVLMTPLALAAPNILIIFADDLGVETMSSYGGESYNTPSIDRLASEGLRFENAHATPLCTPSRVMLLTGKDSWRNYTDFGYLAPGEKTFAQLLQSRGYRTMAVGKWQLVTNKYELLEGMGPTAAGFDNYALWQIAAFEEETDRYWGTAIEVDGQLIERNADQYAPDYFSASLSKFITESSESGQPFLAYYPMVLPHRPFKATPDHADSGENQENFAAMVNYMDGIVGRLLSTLEQADVADNTLVIFVGDNGTDQKISSLRDGKKIAGGKALTLQSATHVPIIVRWPGVVTDGSVSNELIYLADIFPTLAEISGSSEDLPEDIDGQSLMPLLSGVEKQWSRDSLFMHYDPRWSKIVPARFVFDTQWKLYDDGRFFDIQKDELEQSPLNIEALSDGEMLARERLQAHLDMVGGALSGVLSPQAIYRRDRDQRRMVVALAVLVIASIWFGWRKFRKSAIS